MKNELKKSRNVHVCLLVCFLRRNRETLEWDRGFINIRCDWWFERQQFWHCIIYPLYKITSENSHSWRSEFQKRVNLEWNFSEFGAGIVFSHSFSIVTWWIMLNKFSTIHILDNVRYNSLMKRCKWKHSRPEDHKWWTQEL